MPLVQGRPKPLPSAMREDKSQQIHTSAPAFIFDSIEKSSKGEREL